MKYSNIREEEIKNRVAKDFFDEFDCSEIIKDIDFAVKLKRPAGVIDFADEYLLWAEAKQKPSNVFEMLSQLVLTIGKARTFNEILPPPFLGCFDPEKIAFVPYSDVQDIFYQNDFNWKVAPSDYKTKEFQLILQRVKESVENKSFLFYFDKDEEDLRQFISENFIIGKTETSKIRIDKNNFITIYTKWLDTVKPTIAVNWEKAKKKNIFDCDFYLADLISAEDKTLKEKIFVLLHENYYEFDRIIDEDDIYNSKRAEFSDNQKAYAQFWTKYDRPPAKEYWDFMVDSRHLLVPQDVRERKGSFYTPRIWVELSQRYLADVFGKDWQDEYYIWDCAAGTGNLLVGLYNKYNIWASTIDKADVDVMKDRIQNGANLLESHVFQFDFLNDDFSKLPQGLQDIINDPIRRKKLIIYINPPYAEAASSGTIIGTRKNKQGVALHKTKEKYLSLIGNATNELSAQFIARVYDEIPTSKLALFSKLAYLNGANYQKFRKFFLAKLQKGFAIPSFTFDNVNGKFPIGFLIWNTEIKKHFKKEELDVFNTKGENIGTKMFFDGIDCKYINKWYSEFYDKKNTPIGIMNTRGNDVQNYNYIRISSDNNFNHTNFITIENLIPSCVYFAVRKAILPTWLNDRDQFLYPNNKWKKDIEFQNDCLTYTLFHGNNNISIKHGVNHWIPFIEKEVDAKDTYESHIMIKFITGKEIQNAYTDLFEQEGSKLCIKREFSPEATKVFDAGRELWKYYHKQPNINVNASLYDIREYFQGRNDKGKMNNKSEDEKYNELIENLRFTLKNLAQKIEPKVYEYGFLME
ncbi:MAG: hypothetical protein FWH36_02150 [Lentimicrobiaceae bacterium]|nr:hypothetical protein [Lentimicrobiaceae bacterium]